MMDYYPLLRPLLFLLPEETAHHLVLFAARRGMLPPQPAQDIPALKQSIWGLDFPNPLGLAGGFDKHAEAADALLRQGFGFVETGTVTPLPQPGNPKPRLFRLPEDRAIINRFGFNSVGMERFRASLMRQKRRGIVGVNIGKNKESADATQDYLTLLRVFYPLAGYITINISSPNTPGLRELQKHGMLEELLSNLRDTARALAQETGKKTPVLLKIAPDITPEDKEHIARAALEYSVDGLIISNTTLARDGLKNTTRAQEQGGLSGTPLFAPSTRLLGEMYALTGGKVPLVGAGGIFSGVEAYAKIREGASLLQLYTALIYQGFSAVSRINRELSTLLERDGFTHISQAIGADAGKTHVGA